MNKYMVVSETKYELGTNIKYFANDDLLLDEIDRLSLSDDEYLIVAVELNKVLIFEAVEKVSKHKIKN